MRLNQVGRSMVEMLGVLAIIGVLSVGAISGYSKAMMKYKLNKQTEQISTILNNMIIERDKLDQAYLSIEHNGGDMSSGFIKLKLIPEEMISQNNVSIYDVFNNHVYVWDGQDVGRYFRLSVSVTQNTRDTCLNLYNLARLYSNELWKIVLYKSTEDETSGGSIAYGNEYCTKNVTCLKDMNVRDMEEFCSFCYDGTKGCSFNLIYRLR